MADRLSPSVRYLVSWLIRSVRQIATDHGLHLNDLVSKILVYYYFFCLLFFLFIYIFLKTCSWTSPMRPGKYGLRGLDGCRGMLDIAGTKVL